jgi:hypothetical protein
MSPEDSDVTLGFEVVEAGLPLSIGSMIGGTGAQARTWRDAISQLTQRVADARESVTSPLNLNVVFHVPGEILEPDAEYVRAGRYDADTRTLLVQVTVPAEPPSEPDPVLRTRLDDAITEAASWARQRGLPGELTELRRLAASV